MTLAPDSGQVGVTTSRLPKQIDDIGVTLLNGADDLRSQTKLAARIRLREGRAGQGADILVCASGLDQRGQDRGFGAKGDIEGGNRYLRLLRDGLKRGCLVAVLSKELAGSAHYRLACLLGLLRTTR